jgi:putative transposase
VSIEEACRKIGISQATFYAWKKKYAGVGVSELRRTRMRAAVDNSRKK